jgi:hypothetical protein
MGKENILLAEDTDIEHVVKSLSIQQFVSPESFIVKNKQSVEQLLNSLDVEISNPVLQRLAIVLDADLDLSARWQSIRDRLQAIGYIDIPALPNIDGTIIKNTDLPSVGIWLMPNNALPGMVENFVAFLVPENDTLWKRAETCLSQIPQDEKLFGHFIKAHIHTWLAWQEEPGRPLGQAITRRYLDSNALQAGQLIQWLKKVFDL